VSAGETLEQRTARALDASTRILRDSQRVVARARAARAGSAGDRPLTPRQLEILLLLASGAGTRDVARSLWISPATVRNHVAAILAVFGAHTRVQAIAAARRRGLLQEPAPSSQQPLIS
jgi:DNA-binding CsgD family transcriptional regulator